MVTRYPSVDFSWISELPDTYEASRMRAVTKESLADLDSTSIKSLEDKAAALMRAGNIEAGLKLQAAAQARRAQDLKAQEINAYKALQPHILGLYGNRAGAPTSPALAPVAPSFDPLGGGGGGGVPLGPGAAGGPLPMPTSPGPPGPVAAPPSGTIAPPLPDVPPAGNVGPRAAAPSPVQLAALNAGTVSDAPPIGAEPPAQLAQAVTPKPVQTVPIREPVRPPTAPSRPPAISSAEDPYRKLQDRAMEIGAVLSQAGPRSAQQTRALQAEYQSILERLKQPPKVIEYQLDRAQRLASGEPDIGFAAWEDERQLKPESHKRVMEAYMGAGGKGDSAGGYRGERLTSEKLLTTIKQMDTIINHPSFRSGTGVAAQNAVIRGLDGLIKTARLLGVPESTIPNLDEIKGLSGLAQSAKLGDAFTALSNQAIFAKLGTLGNQISEGDRNFINAAFPSLSLTRDGNQILVKILRMAAEKAVDNGLAAEKYLNTRGEARATVTGMDMAVRKAAAENSAFVDKDGRPTKAGEDLKDEIARVLGAESKAPKDLGWLEELGTAVGGAITQGTPFAPPTPRGPTSIPAIPQNRLNLGTPPTPDAKPIVDPDGSMWWELPGGRRIPRNPPRPR